MNPIPAYGLPIACFFLFLQGILAFKVEKKLGKEVFIAGVRTLVQLSLLGFFLTLIFSSGSLFLSFLSLGVMLTAATHAIYSRSRIKYSGALLDCFLSLLISNGLIGVFGLGVIFQKGEWKNASFLLPFLGLVLGNTLNGISLGWSTWWLEIKSQPDLIQFRLAHGATRLEAALPLIQTSLRAALVPILNSMTVAGLVSIPGTMTGQLMAGSDPKSAIDYQIIAFFLICGGILIGSLVSLFFGFRRSFNEQHQFLGIPALHE